MTHESIKKQLNELKKGEIISINGFDIRKMGIQWHVRKGDHYKRSFDFMEIDMLIARILKTSANPVTVQETKGSKREVRRKYKLARKLVKLEKPKKRNGLVIEIINVIFQLGIVALWLAHFFPIEGKFTLQFLGKYVNHALIASVVVAFIVHIFYFRQLGKKHKILNILWGFVSIIGAVLAILYFSHSINMINEYKEILEHAKIIYHDLSAITLLSYLGAKLLVSFLLIKTKKV